MNGQQEDFDSSGIGLPEFQTVDAVQKMILKLEKVKANMILGQSGDLNGTKEPDPPLHGSLFEDLSLLDLSELEFDEREDQWLVQTAELPSPDNEHEKSFLDPGLLNIRFNLLNNVKDVIKEDKEAASKVKREDAIARLNAIKGSHTSVSMTRPELSPVTIPQTVEKSTTNYPTISRGDRHNVYPTISRGYSNDLTSPFKRENGTISGPTDSEHNAVRSHHYLPPSGKQIDTRTYTRPKKNRKSLSVCEDLESQSNSLVEDSPMKAISNISRTEISLNETFNVNEECNRATTPLNMTASISPQNSTPRKVTRNLSYIIRRESDGIVNNNVQTPGILGQTEPFNSTFLCSRDDSSPSDSNNSLHNISMEELHNMARLQEQSLRVTSTPKPITRKDTHTHLELPNIDERPRPPGRTSSTDTYCVVQSNPDSAESSGLSSPMDAQSYEDIQSADAVRRSMPNLALIKGINGSRGPTLQLAPPMNSLKHKSHHISDSKLSHFVPRSAMESRTSSIPSSTNMHYQMRKPNSSYQRPQMSYVSNVPLSASNGSRLPNHNARSGLPTPRYTSIPSRDGGRPNTAVRSMLPTAGSAQQTFAKPQSARVQSRIPAPGAARNRTRPASSAHGTAPKDHADWRDGCY